MRGAVEWLRPSYFAIMAVRSEKSLQALGRVVLGRERRGALGSLQGSIGEEAFLKRVSVPVRLLQTSPVRQHLTKHKLGSTDRNCTLVECCFAHLTSIIDNSGPGLQSLRSPSLSGMFVS